MSLPAAPTLPAMPAARRADPRVLQPLAIDWQPKPVDSARSGVRVLDDGRLQCWIEHDTVRGVTPTMLVWWFQHLEGEITHQGQRVERYRVWHPLDHVRVRYARRLPGGRVGPGAVLHITEMLGGRPEFLVDAKSRIVRLDLGGFAHRPQVLGLPVVAMDYRFERAAGGTRYVNSLTVGLPWRWARPLNALLRRVVFDEAQGQAWIRHNIEEVGQFEAFLPALYAAEAGDLAVL